MIEAFLLADLVANLAPAVRLQRMTGALRTHFGGAAVALLQLDGGHLRPVAVDGLVRDALGRRFPVREHPRLAAILARRDVTCFHHDSALPDPYDGLVDAQPGSPLPVHDCMGTSLHVEGAPWGVLTIDTLQVGAFDRRAQDDLRRFIAYIEAAIRTTRLEDDIRALRMLAREDRSRRTAGTDDNDIVCESAPMRELLHELGIVADSGLPVLLLGETGVGKELIAHRLHRLSHRAAKPLVHVNCAALPESLAESELFGHVKGAFSGATCERAGRFEAADGGTIFLDEVGELPPGIQAKLLRTLQNGEIQRLGADVPRRVDVRVIAATNRQLADHVRNGSFRADLYHRLSVYPIPIPPLRARGHDVLLLAGRFLELNRARLGLRGLRLAPEAERALRDYPWPGNVRELEHVISRAALKAMSRGASRTDIVTLEAGLLDLDAGLAPTSLRAVAGSMPAATREPSDAAAASPTLRDAVAHCQRRLIETALGVHGGNWSQVARQLDVDPSNLHKLARRLGLKAANTARRGLRAVR